MLGKSSAYFVRKFRMLAFVAVCISGFIGALVLLGYLFHLDLLKSVIPGLIPMNPATALLFLLASISVCLLSVKEHGARYARVGMLCAALVALVGLAKVAGYLFGFDIYIDGFLFPTQLALEAQEHGRILRIALNTAINFALIGSALMLTHLDKKPKLAQSLALGALLVAFVAILGYLYHAHSLAEFSQRTPMALNTAFAFIALALGVLFIRTDRGFVVALVADNIGGVLIRRLLLVVIIVPLLLGYVMHEAEHVEMSEPHLRLALLLLANIAISCTVVWRLGISLSHIDEERVGYIEKLKIEKEKTETLLDSIGDGVISIDRDWNIVTWNKTTVALTGWTADEAIGKPFRSILSFIHAEDRKENLAFIDEAMETGKVHFMSGHTVLTRKDGGEIPIGDSAAPVFDADGTVSGAIVVFRDVSKDFELEKMRQEFTSLATHQLRTPITIIRGSIEILADMKPTDEQKEFLEAINQSAITLKELTDAILNVSHVESGTVAVNPEPLYIPDIVESVSKEVVPIADEKNIHFTTHYQENLPTIPADPKLMSAILRNLISNAVKYTPKDGTVTIRVEQKDQQMLIAVSDTGMGIPAHQQPKMFTKFFRADNVRLKNTEGTGLGLYIVKVILEQTGGSIRFESEENKGTTFFVTIPMEGMKKKEGVRGLT